MGLESSRARRAEDFAREVMADESLREGLECLLEGLEWAAFRRWQQSPSGEAWRAIAGELAAYRQMGITFKTLGQLKGKGDVGE